MVQNGEYPNISQAVIGVLRDARFEDERKKFLSDYPTFEDLEKRLTIFKDEIRKDLKNGIREPDTNK